MLRKNKEQALVKREETKKEREEDTMMIKAAEDAEEQESARNRKEQRLKRADQQKMVLVKEIRRKADLAKSRREEEDLRIIEKEKRVGRAAAQRNRTLENIHRMEWSTTTSLEEGQGRKAEVEKRRMITLVVGSSGDQGSKRKRGKKLRWSTEARRKAWEKSLVTRRTRKVRRRIPEQMMIEQEPWIKEEQDMEYIMEETTNTERAEVVYVENLLGAFTIDDGRAEDWEMEEHAWLEELDITMKK